MVPFESILVLERLGERRTEQSATGLKLLAIFRNYSSSMTALVMRLVSVALLFSLTLVLARLLGPEQYGIYAFVFTLMQVSTTIGRGGLMHIMVREIAVSLGAHDIAAARGYLWIGWVVALVMATTMALIFGLILMPLLTEIDDTSYHAQVFGAVYIAAMVLVGMLEAAIRGSGRVLVGQTAELLLRPLVQLTLIALAASGMAGAVMDVRFAVGAATGAAFCAFAYALVFYFRTTVAIDAVPRAPVKAGFLRGLLTLSGTTLIAAINSNLSLIILGAMDMKTEVGFFSIAAQLAALMAIGLMAANASMAPEMNRLSDSPEKSDAPLLQRLASRSCELSLAFGLPLALIYLATGQFLIPFIFGAPYTAAYWPTVILTLGQLLNISFGSVVIMLYADRQESVVLTAIVISILTNLALCLALIPQHGAIGAAIASTTSLAIWNGISFVRLWRRRGIICLPLVTVLNARRRQ